MVTICIIVKLKYLQLGEMIIPGPAVLLDTHFGVAHLPPLLRHLPPTFGCLGLLRYGKRPPALGSHKISFGPATIGSRFLSCHTVYHAAQDLRAA